MRFKIIKKICLLFLFCAFISDAAAAELILKLDNTPLAIGYTDKAGLYCTADGADVLIASTVEKAVVFNLKEHKGTVFALSFSPLTSSFISAGEDNIIVKRNFNSAPPLGVFPLHDTLKLKSIALSPDGKMIAAGLENGFLTVNLTLKLSEKNLDVGFKAHEKTIYSVHFNYNGSYVITAAYDNKIKIWNSENLTLVREFDFFGNNKTPAVFSPVENVFASTLAANEIVIRTLDGKKTASIKTEKSIKNFMFTESGTHLVVLNELNELCVFDTATGNLVGIIPPCIKEELTAFAVKGDMTEIIAGYASGEIYRIKIDKMTKPYLQKKEKAKEKNTPDEEEKPKPDTEAQVEVEVKTEPAPKAVETLEPEETGIEQDEIEREELEQDETAEPAAQRERKFFQYKKYNDAVEFRIGYNGFPNTYFVGNFSFEAGYFFNRWIQPFYFGALIGLGTGFPKKNFPYDYYIDGKKTHSPYLMSIGLYLPSGFMFEPFGNGFYVQMELCAGVQFKRLWNGSFKKAMYGKFFTASAGSLLFGAGYKWIKLNLGVNYDNIFKFSFIAQLAFRIEISYNSAGKNKKKLNNETGTE